MPFLILFIISSVKQEQGIVSKVQKSEMKVKRTKIGKPRRD